MAIERKHYTAMSLRDIERQLLAVKFLLQVRRLTQKEIANLMGIDQHTVGRIIKKHRLQRQADKGHQLAINRPAKYDESLTVFMMDCRIHHKGVLPILDTIYKAHLERMKRSF